MRFIFLNILLFTGIIYTSSTDSCGVVGVIECYTHTIIDVYCYMIQPTDNVIQAALRDCTKGNFVSLYLLTYWHSVTYTVNLTLLPDNIQRLTIRGYNTTNFTDYHLRLITNETHPNIINIEVYYLNLDNTLEESNIFQHFPNLIILKLYDIHLRHNPVLQGLSNLEEVHFIGYSASCDENKVIRVDQSLVGGLVKLKEFIWNSGCIEFIESGAFQDLSELTILFLEYNLIDYNKTQTLDASTFSGLKKLKALSLSGNYIDTLRSEVFQGLSSLVSVYIQNNLLYCSCALQWINIVYNFGVHFLGTCASLNGSAVSLQDDSLYTQCFSELSYQCFNRDNNCTNECIDTATGFVCGCGEGFGLILNQESRCFDIDECLYNQNNCEQECNNTIGSFNCYCNEGYQLTSNGTSCMDIDECNGNSKHYCQQQCTNIIGSYRCSCDAGYTLNTDGATCLDINECKGNNTCSSLCINTPGSYICRCEVGFFLNSTKCTDIDECQLANAGCQHLCVNTEGSYVCDCGAGYQLDSRNVTQCVATRTIILLGIHTSEAVVLCLITLAIVIIAGAGVAVVLFCVLVCCFYIRKRQCKGETLSCITQPVGERQRCKSMPLYESIDANYAKFFSYRARVERSTDEPMFVSLPPTERFPDKDNDCGVSDGNTNNMETNLVFTSPGVMNDPVFNFQESTI